MTASPSSGNQFTISIKVANTGKAQGVKTLQLKVNDDIEAQEEVVLDPGESKVVTFSVTRNKPGSYKASIEPLSAEFTVDSAPPVEDKKPASGSDMDIVGTIVQAVLVGGGLLILLVIVLIIYKKRQRSYYDY